MAQKLNAALPDGLDLPPNFVIRVTAVSPTTGADVTGVNISNVAIVATPVDPDTADSGPLFVPTTPLWLPTPLEDQSGGT